MRAYEIVGQAVADSACGCNLSRVSSCLGSYRRYTGLALERRNSHSINLAFLPEWRRHRNTRLSLTI